MFQTSFSDHTAIFITDMIYVSAFMTQIFLMCVFGQELMSEYDLLSYQLFSSSWPEIVFASKYGDSKNCHKILTMFSVMLEADKNIMIGKVVPLHLKTFTSVRYSFCLNIFYFELCNLYMPSHSLHHEIFSIVIRFWMWLIDSLQYSNKYIGVIRIFQADSVSSKYETFYYYFAVHRC